MLGFFAELGFQFPPFPYVAHSRGWSAEDMERNVAAVKNSAELHEGVAELARRAVMMSERLLKTAPVEKLKRGGRKAHDHDGEFQKPERGLTWLEMVLAVDQGHTLNR
jgi:hypothetical protein